MTTLIAALNSKYIHKALSPWCLKAYCDSRGGACVDILEMTVNDNINTVLENIFLKKPDVIAFSCYIWNIEYVRRLCENLRELLPQAKIILGGPEISDADNSYDLYPFADFVLKGEGEVLFYECLKDIEGSVKMEKVRSAKISDFSKFPSPLTDSYFNSFDNSSDEIKNKLIYYESSRGCPFDCSYCLSGNESRVYYLNLDRVKSEILLLLIKGAKVIKFTDRTFNANRERAYEILSFIKTLDTDATFHFEVAADLFDEKTLLLIAEMPKKRIQLETGIQSTNEKTLDEVCRKTDINKALVNCKKILAAQNTHLHIDLIAGLPYENFERFKKSFNDCIKIRPHMFQLGFLKLLKGSKLRAQKAKYGYKFDVYPPYEVFSNDVMSVSDMFLLKSAERILDKFYNSGLFNASVGFALNELYCDNNYQFFEDFAVFAVNNGGIKKSLKNCYTLLLDFLKTKAGNDSKKQAAYHYIKLDSLSFDSKWQLPDEITELRDREAESEFLKSNKNKYKKIRIEYFDYDKTKRLFIYDEKDILSGSHFAGEII